MKILVTGASGFVGSHLIHFLVSQSMRVAGTFHRHHPHARRGVKFYRCDFSKFNDVHRLIKRLRPTHIFHLIGQSSPSSSWQYPYETLQSNLFSSIHLLEACRQLELKPRILFASSAHVYGRTFVTKAQVTEKDPPRPMDPYGATKLLSEQLFLHYWRQFGIPVVIMRAAAHVGPGQKPIFALSNFSKQIAEIEKKKRKPILHVGNLKAERGFLPVEDAVKAYWTAMRKGKIGEIYNVGSGQVKPMAEWIRLLLQLTRTPIRVWQEPSRKRVIEAPRILVNSRKLSRATGWKESAESPELLETILTWWRHHG